jgi:hypothetical protein
MPGAPLGAADSPIGPSSPADLRDRFEKAEKSLRRASDAIDDHDPGRVSLLLRRADEEIAAFESGSGVASLIAAIAATRSAVGREDWTGAGTALRAGRIGMVSLSDYSVPRSAEVAFRAAQSALGVPDRDGALAALTRLEAATLAPALQSRLRAAHEAVARGRTMMVRNDMKGGRTEVDAARAALDGVAYVGALSGARYGLMVAAELLRDRALLAARDQAQKGLRDLRTAIELAPEAVKPALTEVQTEAAAIWRRINHAEPADADRLAADSESIETVRQQLLP